MKKVQLTLIQIDNYGSWTVSPEPKPERELQQLQARLFAKLEEAFGSRGGLVFATRFDNMLAISNGISLEDHREIQEEVNGNFPVTVSMGIGAGETAYEAQVLATMALQREGSSRDPERVSRVSGSPVTAPDEDWVQIAHMDVNHSAVLTDSEPIYDTHLMLQRTRLALMDSLQRRNALIFYTGGDNFMAPSNGLDGEEIDAVFSEVKRESGAELKAGVGSGPTAEVAAMLASEGLHEIRDGKAPKQVVFKQSPG